MTSKAIHVPAGNEFNKSQPSLADWKSFGAKLNVATYQDVVDGYERAGFIYPAKRARVEPFRSEIGDTWHRMMAAGDSLRRVFSWKSECGERWAYLDVWRATERSWWVQHLVSNGGGRGSLATMLASTVKCFSDPWMTGAEAWYRPKNTFTRRMFSGGADALGRDGGRREHTFLCLPKGGVEGSARQHRIHEVATSTPELVGLASHSRHLRFPEVTALIDDPQLASIDARFRRVGLRRYRKIFTAHDRSGALLGMALAHRGPIGLNLSFLENRCDVLVPEPEHPDAAQVIRSLVHAAVETYSDFPPNFVPVMIAMPRKDPRSTNDGAANSADAAQRVCDALRGEVMHNYSQAVWMRDGLPRLAAYFQGTASASLRRD